MTDDAHATDEPGDEPDDVAVELEPTMPEPGTIVQVGARGGDYAIVVSDSEIVHLGVAAPHDPADLVAVT